MTAALAPRPDPRVGTVVAGCRLVRPLGSGAMGAVYLAAHEPEGTPVVVKLLAADLLSSEPARARFAREAHALSRLPPHANVVHVLALDLEASPPALVLEYAPGTNLEELLRDRGRLAPLEATRVGRDIARGLAVVHAQGIVHRDLKPANVVLGPDGVAKIIDFGVARDAWLSGITLAGQLIGTTMYLAPEQLADAAEGDPDDPRGDLWSLGAVLYHLAAGRPPFDAGDPVELLDLILEGTFPPLRDVISPPPGLEEVVAQLLERDPRRRYARAAEVARDLEHVLAGLPIDVPGLVAPDGQRASLLGRERIVVGRAPGCALVLDDPTVSPRHAQVRRAPAGAELIDLGSAEGTWTDGRRVDGVVLLRDGQEVRVGQVALAFHDPRARAPRTLPGHAPAWGPALLALAERGDPRLTAWTIERALPRLSLLDVGERALAALLGPAPAAAARDHVAAASARDARDALAWLARVHGADGAPGPGGWPGWWIGRRADLPPQLGACGPAALALDLELPGGPAWSRTLGPLDEVVLLGRDPRCQLRLDSPAVSRLHATLARVDRRWALRSESRQGTLLDGHPVPAALLAPGDRLLLGDAALTARAPAPAPGEWSGRPLDRPWFDALVDLGHPSTASALARDVARSGADVEPLARRLAPTPSAVGPLVERLRAALAERAARARAVLERLPPDAARGLQVEPWDEPLAPA